MNSISRTARKVSTRLATREGKDSYRDYIKDCWTSPLTFFSSINFEGYPLPDFQGKARGEAAPAVQFRSDASNASAVPILCADYAKSPAGIPPPTLLLYHTFPVLSREKCKKIPAFAGTFQLDKCHQSFDCFRICSF